MSDGGAGRPEQRDGRQRLLDAAVAWLDTNSEADLRMSAIADEAGVTIALITHHFGSRDGLIEAAQRSRVAGAALQDIRFMQAALSVPLSEAEYRERFEQLMRHVLTDERGQLRLGRIAALAAAHGREALRDELAAEVTLVLSAVEETVVQGQERGVLRSDVDSRAYAAFVQALLLGMVLVDLDTHAPSWDAVRDVVMIAFDNFLASRAASS